MLENWNLRGNQSIYASSFRLSFKDEELEEKAIEASLKETKVRRIFFVCSLILSVLNIGISHLVVHFEPKSFESYFKHIIEAMATLDLVGIVLMLLPNKSKHVMAICNFLISLMFFLFLSSFSIILERLLEVHEYTRLYYLLYTNDIMLKITYFLVADCSFFRMIFSCSLVGVLSASFKYLIFPRDLSFLLCQCLTSLIVTLVLLIFCHLFNQISCIYIARLEKEKQDKNILTKFLNQNEAYVPLIYNYSEKEFLNKDESLEVFFDNSYTNLEIDQRLLRESVSKEIIVVNTDDNLFSKESKTISIFAGLTDIPQNIPEEIGKLKNSHTFEELLDKMIELLPTNFDELLLGKISISSEYIKKKYCKQEKVTHCLFISKIEPKPGHTYISFRMEFSDDLGNESKSTTSKESCKSRRDQSDNRDFLLAKMSHEMKNPLIIVTEVIDDVLDQTSKQSRSNIHSSAFLKEMKEFSTPHLKPFTNQNSNALGALHLIKSISNYMIILIKDLEVLSSISRGVPIDISPDQINLDEFTKEIESISRAFLLKKNLPKRMFDIEVTNHITNLNTDSVRLKQILLNLISNAIKFTSSGSIKLQISFVDPSSGSSLTRRNKPLSTFSKLLKQEDQSYYRFSILDTGIGIPAQNVDTLLAPYNPDKNSERNVSVLNSCFGLKVVKKLLELLDSKLEYSPNQPNGSIFSFTIKSINLSKEKLKLLSAKNKQMFNSDDNSGEVKSSSEKSFSVRNEFTNDLPEFPEFTYRQQRENKESKIFKNTFTFKETSIHEQGLEETEFKESNQDCLDTTIHKNFPTLIPLSLLDRWAQSNETVVSINKPQKHCSFKRMYDLFNHSTCNTIGSIKKTSLQSSKLVAKIYDKSPKLMKINSYKSNTEIDFKVDKVNKHTSKSFDKSNKVREVKVYDIDVINSTFNKRFRKSPPASQLKIIKEINLDFIKKSSYVKPEKSFSLLLDIHSEILNPKDSERQRVIHVLVVDDEKMIRSSVKRILIKQLTSLNSNIQVNIIEACDGIECLVALYLAKLKNIRIDAIISDENMSFIPGSFSSEVIDFGIKNGFLNKVPMFIVTALGRSLNPEKYTEVVQKIYSKPIQKSFIDEIIQSIFAK